MSIADDVSDALAAALRAAGLDTVDGAFAFESGLDLDKPNLAARRRTRLTLTDGDGVEHELYLKRYGPQGLRRRLERFWTYGPGLSAAAVEFDNILAARNASVPTMKALVCGQEPSCCRDGRSYLVVAAVRGDALERCVEEFLARTGDGGAEELTGKLAELVRLLHCAGYVHRDLYASHVFLDEAGGGVSLQLIDLARMFRPAWRRRRWLVKDLAQLKYSMPLRWVERWWGAFLLDYAAGRAAGLSAAIDRKVELMRSRARRKAGK